MGRMSNNNGAIMTDPIWATVIFDKQLLRVDDLCRAFPEHSTTIYPEKDEVYTIVGPEEDSCIAAVNFTHPTHVGFAYIKGLEEDVMDQIDTLIARHGGVRTVPVTTH